MLHNSQLYPLKINREKQGIIQIELSYQCFLIAVVDYSDKHQNGQMALYPVVLV